MAGDTAGMERILGTAPSGAAGGPLVLVTAGVHGNEPGGLVAMRRVLREIERARLPLRGRLAAFVGNCAGLARNVRFVDEDLNRLWTRDRVAELRRSDPRMDSVEEREQRELLALLDAELDVAAGPVTFIDLHSTSGAGPPFTVVAGPDASCEAAARLCVPSLLGLEPLVAGTLIGYLGHLGHAALVLEAGQSEAPATIDHQESAVWITLVGAGVVAGADVHDLDLHRRRLTRAAVGLPGAIEIGYVHRLEPGEEFLMLPGYRSFDPVLEGQLLARSGPDLAHEVRAPWTGTLIMPRYQGQGLDGFFLGRRAAPRGGIAPCG